MSRGCRFIAGTARGAARGYYFTTDELVGDDVQLDSPASSTSLCSHCDRGHQEQLPSPCPASARLPLGWPTLSQPSDDPCSPTRLQDRPGDPRPSYLATSGQEARRQRAPVSPPARGGFSQDTFFA